MNPEHKLTLKLYDTPGDFLRDNAGFLERYEAATQLNQGNAINNADKPCSPELLFGRYEVDGETVLVFGNTRPWNICLNGSHSHGDMPAEAVRMLVQYLKENSVEISGVTGRESLCQVFMEAYGGSFRLRSTMDIMVQKELIEPKPCDGTVRKSTSDDLELVLDWKCAFYREALHEEPDLDRLRERNQEPVANGIIRLLEVCGVPVAMAQTSRKLPLGISISAVYTVPEYRGKGYAQNVVAQICREMLAGEYDYCTLFVNKLNPISNKAYKNIGFEILEDCSEYTLK